MAVYYNENDPFAAAWLRRLMVLDCIAYGEVDERSIADVTPDDLKGFEQCHFFAGIGGWSYALRLAGWPDDRPVWTGSCPCQPYSAAGKRKGAADERNLWPEFYRLIRACRPLVIFGEQVASADVLGRQSQGSRVPTKISAAASSQGFDPSCAGACAQEGRCLRPGPACCRNPGVDRPEHMRSDGPAVQSGRGQDLGQSVTGPMRPGPWLHLLEHSSGVPCGEQRDRRLGRGEAVRDRASDHGETTRRFEHALATARRELDEAIGGTWFPRVCTDLEEAGYSVGSSDLPAAGVGAPHIRQRLYWLAEPSSEQLDGCRDARRGRRELADGSGLGDTVSARLEGCDAGTLGRQRATVERDGAAGFWSAFDLIPCRDGKSRRVESGTFPLAHGAPARVGRLRGYGNAINPEVAKEFILAAVDPGATWTINPFD